MKPHRLLLCATALAVLSGCAVERKPPPVAIAPPRPAPAPIVAPPPADWRDAPVSAGGWFYLAEPAGPTAAFGTGVGQPLFALRCERNVGRVVLRRAGSAAGSVPLSVTTTSGSRSFTAVPDVAAAPEVSVAIPARDAVLDAIAFSRGRFMVEVPGLPTLYLPAWPEVGRVVEDCR